MPAGKWPGRLHFVAVQDSGGTIRDISNDVKTVKAPSSANLPDVSGGGDGHKSFVVGQIDDTVTLDGPFDSGANKAHAVLAGLVGGTAGKEFYYGPAGSSSGYPRKFGSIVCSMYDVNSDVADAVRWTATFAPVDQVGITWGTFA